jgi:hypothetical protein
MKIGNIYAYTGKSPVNGYVGYISINQRENGGIEISIRSEGEVPSLGVITLTPKQCEHMATDLITWINKEKTE